MRHAWHFLFGHPIRKLELGIRHTHRLTVIWTIHCTCGLIVAKTIPAITPDQFHNKEEVKS